MPEKEVVDRAKEDEREGKAPSTQAGEFVREEMHHVREGKHGARSPQQAIAIGLSKARRAGVNLPPRGPSQTRAKARRDLRRGRSGEGRHPSPKRSRAVSGALRREGRSAVSPSSLSRQAHSTARKRGSGSRRRAAVRALHTKGKAGIRGAARKAARTRARHRNAA